MEIVLLIGLQGAGKSSFYRDRFAATHQHVSKDNFPNAHKSDLRQSRLIEAALAQGDSIVIDNTSVSIAVRAPLVTQAKAAGARVIGYYFESRLHDCLERNARREGKARVPDVALYATIGRLELPSYAEGFDALFYVRLGEAGGFVVENWNEDATISHG